MKSTVKFILIAALLSVSFSGHAFSIWTALKSGNTFATNYDVENYICTLHLSDEARIEFFKQANGDFNRYEELRRQWAQKRFNSGLRQMAYVSAVQRHATTSFGKETRAFKITESNYFKRTQELETRTLKKWLDQRLGIVKARIAFAQELKKIGYPHKKDQDDTELFFEWFTLQKNRLKEKIRLEEVSKYEYELALGYQREFYVRPVEIFDFAKEMTSKIDSQIEGARLTPRELAEIVASDEKISIMAKSIELLGPSTLTLSKLSSEAPAVFDDLKTELEKTSLSLNQMPKYFQAADQLAQSKSEAELQESIKEARNKFLLSHNDYTELMKAKIYELSLALKSGEKIEFSELTKYQQIAQEQATRLLQVALNNPEDVDSRIEDHLISGITHLRDQFSSLNKASKEAITLTNWILKFQVKKTTLAIKPQARVTLIDRYSWQGQKRIEDYLRNKQFTERLNEAREGKLSRTGEYIDLRPTKDTRLEGHDSWSFVLEQF